MPEKALFLDRDGVINHEVGYLHRAEDVTFVDGIFSVCRTAQRLGYRLIVVTNQSGIARGLYTVAQFDTLMDWMRTQFRAEGITLDAVYYCPYHPRHGIGEFLREHEDRKPGPGMLHRGAAAFSLDLTQSLMVGDRCSDIAAANAAGLRQAFLIAGTEPTPCPGDFLPIDQLSELESWIVANTP
jgi:D-glycero-D-manno-heptose 1,7-bisphosphate phosphatase